MNTLHSMLNTSKQAMAEKVLTRQQEIYHALRSVVWAVWYDPLRDAEGYKTGSNHWHYERNSSEEQFKLLNNLGGDCFDAFAGKMMQRGESMLTREEEVMYLWFMSLVIEDGMLTTEHNGSAPL